MLFFLVLYADFYSCVAIPYASFGQRGSWKKLRLSEPVFPDYYFLFRPRETETAREEYRKAKVEKSIVALESRSCLQGSKEK